MSPSPVPRRPRRRVAAVLAASAALLLAGSAPAFAAKAPTYKNYVSLGDSYVASPLNTPPVGNPPGCLRSATNYPRLVAQQIGATLTDVSCSGATTVEFSKPQVTNAGVNPPQYDGLTKKTDLVSVTIGGNDVGFTGIIQQCAQLTAQMPTADHPCQDYYTAGGTDQLRARIDATAPKIATALQTVRSRTSKKTTILMVGYLDILPQTNTNCPPNIPYAPGDVGYLRGIEEYLNAMLAQQAGANTARYVDTYTPTIGHDACQLSPNEWVEGLTPRLPAYPVHPNVFGQRADARAVLGALG